MITNFPNTISSEENFLSVIFSFHMYTCPYHFLFSHACTSLSTHTHFLTCVECETPHQRSDRHQYQLDPPPPWVGVDLTGPLDWCNEKIPSVHDIHHIDGDLSNQENIRVICRTSLSLCSLDDLRPPTSKNEKPHTHVSDSFPTCNDNFQPYHQVPVMTTFNHFIRCLSLTRSLNIRKIHNTQRKLQI
jgi:hypothetical protein